MQAWPRRFINLQRGLAVVLAIVSGLAFAALGERWALGLGGLAVGLVYYRLATRRYRRRRRLLARPMPERWREVLEERVEYYRRLPGEAKRRFEDNVRIFLSEQRIYPVHGARVDDEVRLLIAASAAMLSHGWPGWEWENLRDILVYPSRFDEEYRVQRRAHVAGMVHAQGPIILSRQELRHGFNRPRDGHNVALHELAHVLDMAGGYADGVPVDVDWVAEAPWVRMVAEGLARLRDPDVEHVLRDYAGLNEAEFFAVAVEVFFEQPERLKEHDPRLYGMLATYFRQDPAARVGADGGAEPPEAPA